VGGAWRDWYGPHPTTNQERAAWATLRERAAARVKRTEEEEPAADSDGE
jgi:hypothetical protein